MHKKMTYLAYRMQLRKRRTNRSRACKLAQDWATPRSTRGTTLRTLWELRRPLVRFLVVCLWRQVKREAHTRAYNSVSLPCKLSHPVTDTMQSVLRPEPSVPLKFLFSGNNDCGFLYLLCDCRAWVFSATYCSSNSCCVYLGFAFFLFGKSWATLQMLT